MYAKIALSFRKILIPVQFARLYWRVYYEQNGRCVGLRLVRIIRAKISRRLFYTRIMRFSLDALVLGQVVTMALFFVLKDTKNGGACAVSFFNCSLERSADVIRAQALIPLTVITKLVLTRWYDTHMNAADSAFADVVTGQKSVAQLQPSQAPTEGATEDSLQANKPLNRRSVNKRLGGLALPDLSIMDTLKLPLHARKNLKTDKGPQGAIVRLAKRLHHSGAYSEIRDSNAARVESNVEAAKDLSAPSAEKTLQALENPAGRPRALSTLSSLPQRASTDLVVPHPRLQRDDRPDFSAPYIDPYLVQEVERHLWLPRDPLYAVDLDDTIGLYRQFPIGKAHADFPLRLVRPSLGVFRRRRWANRCLEPCRGGGGR